MTSKTNLFFTDLNHHKPTIQQMYLKGNQTPNQKQTQNNKQTDLSQVLLLNIIETIFLHHSQPLIEKKFWSKSWFYNSWQLRSWSPNCQETDTFNLLLFCMLVSLTDLMLRRTPAVTVFHKYCVCFTTWYICCALLSLIMRSDDNNKDKE